MSAMTCSLSGAPIIKGVICLKTGHLYQQSSIIKYVSIYGKCPHTGVPLTAIDFKEIQGTNTAILSNGQSVSSLTNKLSSQFDALVLETHFLKKTLQESKEELTTSLYHQDAAIRVIARLKAERDSSRNQVAELIEKIRVLENN